MRHFNSLNEMIIEKAKSQHLSNLDRGGCFTTDTEASINEGYEIGRGRRISKMSIELKYAATRVQWCSAELAEITVGFASEKPVKYIKNFGYVEL